MSDASQREWRFYLDDMIEFARKVLACTEGLDQEQFDVGPDLVCAGGAADISRR